MPEGASSTRKSIPTSRGGESSSVMLIVRGGSEQCG